MLSPKQLKIRTECAKAKDFLPQCVSLAEQISLAFEKLDEGYHKTSYY